MADVLVSAADLTYLRAEAERALPDVISIQTYSRTSDAYGGFTEAWVDAYQDVPARLSEMNGRESAFASRIGVTAAWMLTVPWDQALEERMRVAHKGIVYEVIFVNAGRSHDTARRALLSAVK